MATYKEEDGISYTEFFAWNKTKATSLNDLRDSDCCSELLTKYNSKKQSDGWFRRYWENGNLRYEWRFVNGKQNGVSRAWWPNGDLKNERIYEAGNPHGPLIGWYENGKISGIRHYDNGNRVGVWTDYYEDGQMWFAGKYENDKLIFAQYWNEDGSEGKKSCHEKGELKFFRKYNPNYK